MPVMNEVIPEMPKGPSPELLQSPSQDDWSVRPKLAYWVYAKEWRKGNVRMEDEQKLPSQKVSYEQLQVQ